MNYYNPYEKLAQPGRSWVKTNFHTHAGICEPGNCGELPMDEVLKAYRKAGYGALAISNHNVFLEHPEEWEGMAVLDAVEYSRHPHLLQLGVREYREVDHQQAVYNTAGAGGMAVLCHPNWMRKEYWKWEEMEQLQGYVGIEILNPVIYTLSGSGLALDAWDHLLSAGRRVWGFGNDDFHQWRDIERAYNVIFAASNRFADLKQAVEEGCFYVSNGVALKEFQFDGKTLHVAAQLFTPTYLDQYTFRFVGENGEVLKEAQGSEAEYELTGQERYVRVEATAEYGAKMFLQPVWRES